LKKFSDKWDKKEKRYTRYNFLRDFINFDWLFHHPKRIVRATGPILILLGFWHVGYVLFLYTSYAIELMFWTGY